MDVAKFIRTMVQWEGKLSRHPADSAAKYPCPTPYRDGLKYHTNKGITYATWSGYFGNKNDARFYAMSDQDWFTIFSKLYYLPVKGDKFKCPNIGYMVSEFAWGSGVNPAVKTLQRACNNMGAKLEVDGLIGNKTLEFANNADPKILFDNLIQERKEFFIAISKGKNAVFLKGWLNRLSNNAELFRP